jgi:hypothetical protein
MPAELLMLRSIIAVSERSKVWNYHPATSAVGLGDKERAFGFLNKGYETRDQFTLFAQIDPAIDPLRLDSRGAIWRKKPGFPE